MIPSILVLGLLAQAPAPAELPPAQTQPSRPVPEKPSADAPANPRGTIVARSPEQAFRTFYLALLTRDEPTLRTFYLALLTRDEPTLRAITLPHDDFASLLKTTGTPALPTGEIRDAVARLPLRFPRAGQTVTFPGSLPIEIGPNDVTADRAVVVALGASYPITVRQVEGRWLVDAAPVIARYKAAARPAQPGSETPPDVSGLGLPLTSPGDRNDTREVRPEGGVLDPPR